MRLLIVAAGIGTVLIAGGLWLTSGDTEIRLTPDDAQVVAQGTELYGTYCASCHGQALEGEPNWQDRDAEGYLPAPPHDETGHTWHHPDRQLFEITKYGTEAIVGGGYLSRMPGFEDTLTDTETLAVLSYIKSTWPRDIAARHDQINARSQQ